MAVLSCLKGKCSIPERNEVQIEGGACGICSWDVVTAKLGNQMHPMAPPGHEGVGYVAKIGAGVTDFKEGDRVAGGGFANVRNLSAQRVFQNPGIRFTRRILDC